MNLDDAILIADTPAALTPEWLTAALRAGGVLDDAVVTRHPSRPSAPARCATACDSTLTFDRPTDAPTTVVAKLPAADPTSRATALVVAQLRDRGAVLPRARTRRCRSARPRSSTPTSTSRPRASCC